MTIDKQWIQKRYLPELSGKILFVGSMPDYHNLVKTPELFESLDFDPTAASKGNVSPYKHHICDFLDFQNEYTYDHISLHGLWGNGFIFKDGTLETNKTELTKIIINSIKKAHSLLNVGGTLQIGPNTNNVNPIYEYLVSELEYELLDRIPRSSKGCSNNIFWGKKIKNSNFTFNKENLWDIIINAIETKGLFNG